MTEQEAQEILNPEWCRAIEQGIKDALDNYELLGQVNVAPASFAEANDGRGFPECSFREQIFIEQTLYRALKYTPDGPAGVLITHKTSDPEGANWSGTAKVQVCSTGRSEEGMFLHIIAFPDGKLDYIVAPQDFRL